MGTVLAVIEKVETMGKIELPHFCKKRGESRKTVVDAASKMFRGCAVDANRTILIRH